VQKLEGSIINLGNDNLTFAQEAKKNAK